MGEVDYNIYLALRSFCLGLGQPSSNRFLSSHIMIDSYYSFEKKAEYARPRYFKTSRQELRQLCEMMLSTIVVPPSFFKYNGDILIMAPRAE